MDLLPTTKDEPACAGSSLTIACENSTGNERNPFEFAFCLESLPLPWLAMARPKLIALSC